jgi:branched-chain amino acid transport system substrate-binding protein
VKIKAVTLFLVLVLLLGGCVQQQGGGTVKIGVIAPLTGFLAFAGEDTKNALELALEEIPEGRVQLVYEDGACDAAKAMTAYKKLRDVDGVNYIIGPLCGQSAMAALPLINKDKIIAISSGAPDNELAKPNDYFFRTQIPNELETKKISEFLIESGLTTAATYTAKNTFGESYKNSFIENFSALGGNIVFSEGSQDYQSDFRTEIIKMLEKNPQAVFLVTASRNQMGIFVKQARELGFGGKIVGGSVTEEKELLDAAGNAADGVLYVHYIDRENLTEKQAAFFERFREKYGKEPGVRVLTAYDAFRILYSKIVECGKENVECVRQKLNKLHEYDGLIGRISFNENGDAVVPLAIKTIKNGRFVLYEGNLNDSS